MAVHGSRRFGRYLLRRELGHGVMGTVYLAEDTQTHREVALKVLPAAIAANGEYTQRFLTEARIASQLDHPNIVKVVDYGKLNGHYYLAMPFVDGESCKARIHRQGKLPWREAVGLAIEVARGLAAAARQGIIHRDVKPENILIDSRGKVHITDLGLAKEVGVMHPMPSDTSLGTPDYMSPEQVNNSETVDLRSDIYSLGATLFHMICGKAPYTGHSAYEVMVKQVSAVRPSPAACVPDLPKPVCDVLRKMMARDPEDRYQDYEELIADLEALLAGRPVSAEGFCEDSLLGANGLRNRTTGRRRPGRLLWIAVAAPVVAAIVLALAYALSSG